MLLRFWTQQRNFLTAGFWSLYSVKFCIMRLPHKTRADTTRANTAGTQGLRSLRAHCKCHAFASSLPLARLWANLRLAPAPCKMVLWGSQGNEVSKSNCSARRVIKLLARTGPCKLRMPRSCGRCASSRVHASSRWKDDGNVTAEGLQIGRIAYKNDLPRNMLRHDAQAYAQAYAQARFDQA